MTEGSEPEITPDVKRAIIFAIPAVVKRQWYMLSSRFRSVLSIIYHFLTVAFAIFFVFGERIEDVEKRFFKEGCYYRDYDGAIDKTRPKRPCLAEKPTYVQWNDPTHYEGRPRES